ncbi:SGNH/GDSL hydrolase family protein [Cryptosporangium arvum]|uniref:Lysophospholipase L1-like esterase n=1 Tax=Cryptosporangium arvum DSM 44712 TaxID=927661 RepID=A0A010Z5W5_9ACTN|nr:GDSL-type esterase/lipase family protein [Cryptosporangium arvum]EXG82713.1 lysophospholipase L1-like esterase [Cryptosporangium arvum DSM 44712]
MINTSVYTDEQRRHFLRYTRTRQWPMLGRFPVAAPRHTELLAGMLSCPVAVVEDLIASLADEARATAAELLRDETYRAALGSLPYRPGDRVVAVGDSITADRLGWFELLRTSLELGGADGPTLVNLSVSGDTTADVIERFDLLQAAEPSRVLLMLGTNDARAHGRAGGYRMATTAETGRNLRALRHLITRDLGADVTMITPTAVDQARVDATFADAPVHWSASAVAEIAAAVRDTDPGAVDLHEATRTAAPGHLQDDGVHPTVAGQRFILTHLLEHLAAPTRHGSGWGAAAPSS